ncbi:PL29 family lyase N-terminal domain-containing protein [Bacteroides sp.]|mgnify:FL=1|jgi:hypothetical protein|uniref:PL29 family lyase N-terminal domain-containing protein n=1 Tax=Bacteroides sp. TaxID=29523 RepID=UPI00258B93C1|nr:PL29 family lyase N-terminal domain-containing protein [Bacteroides sp.]
MKFYQSFILFSLFTLAFVSCNTDDLERDIDALKDRVASFETQVQQLNDEMNIIRVLLDGNKTITDYSIDGDTYTLTLSNGETLTLTPGVVGGNYPSIEIGENGNWFIGGEDTGKRAKAENGNDAEITPQFKIEANPADGDKKYWYVSYDEGKNWSVLENGCAEGTNTSENPIESAVVEGDNFKVVLSDGSEHFIPIVQGLECAINIPEGVTDGLWSVAGGGQSPFTVKVKLAEGDLVRVNAPADWNAKVSKYQVGDTEVTVTVTPPSTPSECIIVVEVTHGVNTATDQIKARTTSDSYWAEYQAGLDIKIGDVVINKFDYPDAVLVSAANIAQFTKFETDKVYFLNTDITPTAATTVKKYLYLINDNSTKSSKVTFNEGISIMFDYLGDTGEGFLCKDLNIDCTANTKYMSSLAVNKENLNEGCVFERYVLDGCTVKLGKGLLLAHYSNGNKATNIKEIVLESCRFILTEATSKIISLNNANPTFASSTFLIKNNILYTTNETEQVNLNLLAYGNAYTNFEVERNTFVNVVPDTQQAYIQTIPDYHSLLSKNIGWNSVDGTARCHWISSKKDEATSLDKANFEDNLVFDTSGVQWLFFRNGYSLPAGMTNGMKLLTESPFVSMDFSTGKFILNDTYNGKYGSDIK